MQNNKLSPTNPLDLDVLEESQNKKIVSLLSQALQCPYDCIYFWTWKLVQ